MNQRIGREVHINSSIHIGREVKRRTPEIFRMAFPAIFGAQSHRSLYTWKYANLLSARGFFGGPVFGASM